MKRVLVNTCMIYPGSVDAIMSAPGENTLLLTAKLEEIAALRNEHESVAEHVRALRNEHESNARYHQELANELRELDEDAGRIRETVIALGAMDLNDEEGEIVATNIEEAGQYQIAGRRQLDRVRRRRERKARIFFLLASFLIIVLLIVILYMNS